MQNFLDWGIRIRENKDLNYKSVWLNLKTTRIDLGEAKELPDIESEFYDVGLGTKCNANCAFCYVSANNEGEFWKNPEKLWIKFIEMLPKDEKINLDEFFKLNKKDSLDIRSFKAEVNFVSDLFGVTKTHKPFQIAIGSTCEPTIHPNFCEFLEVVHNTKVVPNYTTNGILLSNSNKNQKLLEYTNNFCGGVAVSFGNKNLSNYSEKAIEQLIKYGNCKIVIHHIIYDSKSVDEFLEYQKRYADSVHYHVLLPLMAHGRSNDKMDENTFLYLADKVKNIKNVAFGANFTPFIKKHDGLLNIWEYPQEIYSKNMLLKNDVIEITPSSFNLTVKTIIKWK